MQDTRLVTILLRRKFRLCRLYIGLHDGARPAPTNNQSHIFVHFLAPFIFLYTGNDDDSGAEEFTNVEKRPMGYFI